jgi:hypothetical protein
MIRRTIRTLLMLSLLAATLGGCVVYEQAPYHPHPYYWR